MMVGQNRRVLVIDDNEAIHDDYRKILSPNSELDPSLKNAEAAFFATGAFVAVVFFVVVFFAVVFLVEDAVLPAVVDLLVFLVAKAHPGDARRAVYRWRPRTRRRRLTPRRQ